MEKLSFNEARQINNDSPGNQIHTLGGKVKQAMRGTRIKAVYDFDQVGGAVAELALFDDENKPATLKNVIVREIISRETEALTSGGAATVQLKAGSTNLTGLIAFDSGFTGIDEQALASGDGILVADEASLVVDIATAALTAGSVEFYLDVIEID